MPTRNRLTIIIKFSRIRTEYGEVLRISMYSVRMRENAGQKNSEYRYFFTVSLFEISLFNTE